MQLRQIGGPAMKDTAVDGPMAMGSPVRGFRPVRAGLDFAANLPKPGTVTISPRASASPMAANTASTAVSAARFVTYASPATRSTMSFLFIHSLPEIRDSGYRGRSPSPHVHSIPATETALAAPQSSRRRGTSHARTLPGSGIDRRGFAIPDAPRAPTSAR